VLPPTDGGGQAASISWGDSSIKSLAPSLMPAQKPKKKGGLMSRKVKEAPTVGLSIIDEAKRSGKPVLVFIYSAGDKRCTSIEKFIFSSPGVVSLSTQFHSVRLDAKTIDKALLKRYRVRRVPTMLFLAPNGRRLATCGAKSSPARFAALMKKVLRSVEILKKKGRLRS